MLWVFDHATADRLQAGMVEFPVIGEIISQAFSQIFYGADINQTIKTTDKKINETMHTFKSRSEN
jgi:multiple sugar transport system substrate-binding protein